MDRYHFEADTRVTEWIRQMEEEDYEIEKFEDGYAIYDRKAGSSPGQEIAWCSDISHAITITRLLNEMRGAP
jgi:hypothetical protein